MAFTAYLKHNIPLEIQLKGYEMVLSLFSCVWLLLPQNCSSPGSSVHGISQARILKWDSGFLNLSALFVSFIVWYYPYGGRRVAGSLVCGRLYYFPNIFFPPTGPSLRKGFCFPPPHWWVWLCNLFWPWLLLAFFCTHRFHWVLGTALSLWPFKDKGVTEPLCG